MYKVIKRANRLTLLVLVAALMAASLFCMIVASGSAMIERAEAQQEKLAKEQRDEKSQKPRDDHNKLNFRLDLTEMVGQGTADGMVEGPVEAFLLQVTRQTTGCVNFITRDLKPSTLRENRRVPATAMTIGTLIRYHLRLGVRAEQEGSVLRLRELTPEELEISSALGLAIKNQHRLNIQGQMARDSRSYVSNLAQKLSMIAQENRSLRDLVQAQATDLAELRKRVETLEAAAGQDGGQK